MCGHVGSLHVNQSWDSWTIFLYKHFCCNLHGYWVLVCCYLQLNQVSPQQTDVIEHHYKVYERLQKIKAETEEVSANRQKQKLDCITFCPARGYWYQFVWYEPHMLENLNYELSGKKLNSEWSFGWQVDNFFKSHGFYRLYGIYTWNLIFWTNCKPSVSIVNANRLKRQQRLRLMHLVKCTGSGTMKWWDWPMVK